jgi:putative NADH-flavin reductase
VLDELLQVEFTLTVLTRSASSIKDAPADVEVCEVDYASEKSIFSALGAHDAVVSTVAGAAVAGIKHFSPADYAMCLRRLGLLIMPPYTDVIY